MQELEAYLVQPFNVIRTIQVGWWVFIGSGPGPVSDFGTERALAEPLGPNTGNFPNSCPRFTLLTELNLSLKARPEAHTFDFITGEGLPVRAEAKIHSLGRLTA